MRSRVRAAGINALLLAGVLVAMGVLVEGIVRVTVDADAGTGATMVTSYDTLLGWSKVPGTQVRQHTSEYDVVEHINAHGLRGPDVPFEKPDGTQRVLLLGDSFLEGYTVADDETVAAVLGQLLNARTVAPGPVEVINGGTAGYATDQELLFFERDGRRYSPDVTVLLFYVNDVWFNARSRYWRGFKPRFVVEGDSLRPTNVPVPPPDPTVFAFQVQGGRGIVRFIRRTDGWFGRHSRAYGLFRNTVTGIPAVQGFLIRRGLGAVPGEWRAWSRHPDTTLQAAWQVTEALLKQMRTEVEEAGSRFLIFYVPPRPAVYPDDWRRTRTAYAMTDDQWSPTADADRLSAICERDAITCVVPLSRFRREAERLAGEGRALYFNRDAHWSPDGHRLAGEVIAEYVAAMLSPPSPHGKD